MSVLLPAEVLALLGENGAGKSTLIRLVGSAEDLDECALAGPVFAKQSQDLSRPHIRNH